MKKVTFTSILMVILCLLPNLNLFSQLIPRKTAPLYLTVSELKTWTTTGSTASSANVSTEPIASRQYDLNSQLDPNQSFDMKVDWCPDGMDIWSNYIGEQNQFNLFNFTHWQYVDKLTWFCNAASGVFIPSKPWIDAAHRNGVKIVGTVFFAGSATAVSDFVQKSGSTYIAAQKLIDIANYYGFDGWFFNEETSVSSTVATEMIALLKQLQTIKPANMDISWYDAMIPSGSVSYQNCLNNTNKRLVQDGTTRVSDALFTNYWWGSSQVSTSVSTASSIGRSAFDVYTGCDIWPGRTGAQGLFTYNSTFMNTLYTNSNITQPRTSAAIFAANLTWNGGFHTFNTDPADYDNFYKTEVRLFSGDDYNITTTDASGWKGFGYYWPVRTVITSLPFETSFNVGQGKVFATDGSQTAKNWTDMGKQNILPSWQWAKTGAANIDVGYDFDNAYNGGSSVKLSGSLNNNNAIIKLFQTKLSISSQSKFDLTYKAGTSGASYLKLLLYFSDNVSTPVELDLGNVPNTNWNTFTFDLAAYSGRELAIIGVKAISTTSISNYSMNIGQFKVYDGAAIPQKPVANFTASNTNIATGQSVTFTDQSLYSPTSWSWAFNGGTPASSTDQDPVITYNTAGTYSVTLTATNTQGSNTSTKTNYITVADVPLSYCTSQGNNWSYLWIGGVSVGTFNNTSGAAGYTDFTSQVISMVEGNNTVSLTPGYPGTQYNVGWNVWIDLNKDGDFADSGENVFTSSISTSVANGTINIPPSFSGQTRMRVSMKYNANPTSCETFTYGEVEDYTIHVTVSTEPPVANFIASATSVNVGQSVTFTDQSTNTPTSWSWTFNGGTPTNSSTQNPVVTYNAAGTYTVSLTATNANGSDTKTATNYITVSDAPVTYCTSQGNNSTYEWIAGVTIGSFSNTSGAANYTDFTSQTVAMVAGSSYAVTLTPGFSSSTYLEYWKIWIDFNKNGDFSDTGEEFNIGNGNAAVNGNIAIPSTATGQTRMRVSMKYDALQTSSCEAFAYGEVEDYTVNISGAAAASLLKNTNEPAQLSNTVSEKASKKFVVYPNPANDIIHVDGNFAEGSLLKISNILGMIVREVEWNTSNRELNVSELPTGNYWIIVTDKNSISKEQFIKK